MKHLIPAVKHGDEELIFWACFTATEPEHLAGIECTMNSSVYQSNLESNVRPSFWQLKLDGNLLMQQDSDQQIHKIVVEKEKNLGVVMIQLKSRAQPD